MTSIIETLWINKYLTHDCIKGCPDVIEDAQSLCYIKFYYIF